MEHRMFSLFVVTLVAAVFALEGRIVNIPTSFTAHKPSSIQRSSSVKDELPTIKDSNEPQKKQTETVSTFCNVEISTKIPGNCITVGQLGKACVAGDYLDLFSVDCM